MATEYSFKAVVAFSNLPENEEIKEIKRQYLYDEVDAHEFSDLCIRYLETNGMRWDGQSWEKQK